jgi:hypothetical protein
MTDATIASPGRACGDCTLCCKLLGVGEPLNKPANQWCVHCAPGKGCRIYDTRPPICRSFTCEWLREPAVSDEWRPTRSKIVLVVTKEQNGIHFHVYVDPSVPNRWREAPYHAQLKRMAASNMGGVYIYVRGKNFRILPTGEAIEKPAGT